VRNAGIARSIKRRTFSMLSSALRRGRREVAIERGPERMFYDCTEIDVVDSDGHALCFGRCD
jgi:hypothetical protein